MAGRVNPPVVSDGSSGAVGTNGTRAAGHLEFSGGRFFFSFSRERKAKVCDVRNGLRRSYLLIATAFTLGVGWGGLKNICGWIVQPCLCETEVVCRMTEWVCHWQPRLHARAREQA